MTEIHAREQWNALVLGLPGGDLRQGYEWGEVRSSQGWTARRLAITRDSTCVAAAAVLLKRMPSGHSILYAPGGPQVRDLKDDEAWGALLDAIRRIADEARGIFLRVDPKVPDDDAGVRQALVAHGFRHLPESWTTWNTPRIFMTLDLRQPEETLRLNLRKRYREYIASAAKRGVTVRASASLEEVLEFCASLAAAGRRKGLPVRGQAYFERLWREYVRPGRGVLLLAEHRGALVGGIVGARQGATAYMLYVAIRDTVSGEKLQQGPLLYWEFIRWAKDAGCASIDWGGIGTNFPPQRDDPGFGVYHFKLGFNSALEYLTGYYDLVIRPTEYRAFRFLEQWVAHVAWSARAKLNGRFARARSLVDGGARKTRQFRVSLSQRGLRSTLYWAAFGFLRPNRFVILSRDLGESGISYTPPARITTELWEASAVRSWRRSRVGLPPEFYQDEVDGVGTAAVVLVDGELAGLIWVYQTEDPSRLFQLGELEVELNHGSVLPQFRGARLFREVLAFACAWLADHGYRTVYAGVHDGNKPSLRAFLGAGFQDIGAVSHAGLFRPKYHRAEDSEAAAVEQGQP